MSRIFVGNIPFSCTNHDLQHWFEAHGYETADVEIIHDRATCLPRGFAFVELRFAWKVQQAIHSLHHKELSGRKLTVNVATPMGSNRKSDPEFIGSR